MLPNTTCRRTRFGARGHVVRCAVALAGMIGFVAPVQAQPKKPLTAEQRAAAVREDSLDALRDMVDRVQRFEHITPFFRGLPPKSNVPNGLGQRVTAMQGLLSNRPSAVFGEDADTLKSLESAPGVRAFLCETEIGLFCFGPRNGGINYLGTQTPGASGRFATMWMRDKKGFADAKRRAFTELALATKRVPGDHWLAGLRVWLPLEFNEVSNAERSLRDCRAERWWCELLTMYVLYLREAIEPADSVLGLALRHMTPAARCVWGDVSRLIRDAGIRARYVRMTCGERTGFEERFWWLADPFLAAPGNERRTEQFARAVRLVLGAEYHVATIDSGLNWGLARVERAVHDFSVTNPEDVVRPDATALRPLEERVGRLVGGWDNNEVILRAGLWSTQIPGLGWGEAIYRQLPHAQYTAAAHAIDAPFRAVASDWEINPRAPWEWMESRFGPVYQLDYQLARFLRGDSTRIVAATNIGSHPEFLASDIVAVLALSKGPRAQPMLFRTNTEYRYVFSPVVATDSALAGIEIQAERAVAWARFGVAPLPGVTGRLRLSDVALYSVVDSAALGPRDLDAALSSVLTTTRLAQGARVGMFWEMYGSTAGEETEFTLSAQRLDTANGARRTVARLFGSSANPVPMRLVWKDPPSAGRPIETRTLAVNLSTLEPGRYRLQLTAALPGQAPVTAEREIEILRKR
jgi:hypothetical protein